MPVDSTAGDRSSTPAPSESVPCTWTAISKLVGGDAIPSPAPTTNKQASHRHGAGAQERVCGHGLKQYGGPVGKAIIKASTPFEAGVKTLTYDNGKEFCGRALIDEACRVKATLRAGSVAATRCPDLPRFQWYVAPIFAKETPDEKHHRREN